MCGYVCMSVCVCACVYVCISVCNVVQLRKLNIVNGRNLKCPSAPGTSWKQRTAHG